MTYTIGRAALMDRRYYCDRCGASGCALQLTVHELPKRMVDLCAKCMGEFKQWLGKRDDLDLHRRVDNGDPPE